MWIDLNAKSQKLYELLNQIPPLYHQAENYIITEMLTSEEVTMAGIAYADDCFCEVAFKMNERNKTEDEIDRSFLRSSYIYEVIKFLLKYKLDPNYVYQDDLNIMQCLFNVDNNSLGADAVALLLEHGGDPNLTVGGELLFEALNFDMFFGSYRGFFDTLYRNMGHCWMVMMGCGAENKKNAVTFFKEFEKEDIFDIKKLKNHRQYYFGITHLKDDIAISIFDKETSWEVMRIE